MSLPKNTSPVFAIVDAYSTGKYLAPNLQKKGFNCIHVQSSPKIFSFQRASYVESDFIDVVIHDDNIERTVSKLSKFNLKGVIPGSEAGVELADTLSENLGLLSNGTELSKARRNKYKMTETIKKSGLPSVEHFKSDRLEAILDWVEQLESWPIVVKPLESAATDGVKICHSQEEVVQAFNAIIGKNNNFVGIKNEEVLVQKYLQGTEYIINTVSYESKHYVTDIWQCTKKYQQGANVYDLEELIPYEGEKQNALTNYIYSVLDALGIKYGAAHSEVMFTPNGPILIEVGARLHGSINPNAVTECIGFNHVTVTVDSYTEPLKFLELAKTPYTLHKRAFCLALISEISGTIKAIPGIDRIKQLPSFYSASISLSVNDVLEKTTDLMNSPGIIYLVHEDKSVLEKDYQAIRNLEKQNFYEVV